MEIIDKNLDGDQLEDQLRSQLNEITDFIEGPLSEN